MSILITAMALAAAPASTAAQPAPLTPPVMQMQHAQPAKPGTKAEGDGCCCKKMAAGGKMACCAEHGKNPAGGHSGHGASR